MWDSKKTYFYHPFLQSSIGFFSQSPSNSGSSYGEVITNVNLYYQPLQYPILAIVYLILRIIIIILGEFVQLQVLKLLKRECSIEADILKVFLYFQMVYWPVFVLFHTSTDFVHPLREVVGEWYCILGFLCIIYGMTFVGFHSFVVGLMRYAFVVHNERVGKFGIERVKRIFFWMSILAPLVATLMRFFGRLEVSAVSSLNKCDGIHHMSFLIENSISSTARKNMCIFHYDDDDWQIFGNKSLAILKRVLCTLTNILYLIMGFNLVEGILYWRTVKHGNK